MRSQLVTALLTLAVTGRVAAQDRPAEIVEASPVRYPEVLRAAGIGGVVRAVVIVPSADTGGPEAVRILATPHPGFNNAVVEGLRRWRYRVAVRDGVVAADTIEVELAFDVGGSEALGFGPMQLRDLVRDTIGMWHATVSPIIVRGRGRELRGAQRDTAALSAARFLAVGLEKTAGGGARIACVALRSDRGQEPLTANELAALQAPGVAIVHPGRCPPKFASMVLVIGRVIPPGPDPAHIVVEGAKEYPGGWVVIRVNVGGNGAGYDMLDCLLRGAALDRVEACQVKGSVVF